MELLDANAMTLFQPVFEKDGLLAAIDVLQFDDAAGEYAIHEIKSSTEILVQMLQVQELPGRDHIGNEKSAGVDLFEL